jgi:hypothetical protein
MGRWIAIAVGAVLAYAVMTSLPEMERYRRIRAM